MNRRDVVFRTVRSRTGWWRFWWRMLWLDTRWEILLAVAREHLELRRAAGDRYDEPRPGVHISLAMSESEWLASTRTARKLMMCRWKCHKAIVER